MCRTAVKRARSVTFTTTVRICGGNYETFVRRTEDALQHKLCFTLDRNSRFDLSWEIKELGLLDEE